MNLITAADKNWAIGRDGRELVTIPAHQQLFLHMTAGKVVVMGRKALEQLPGGRPLSQRVNVILSRDLNYSMKGAVVCHSLKEALKVLEQYASEDIYVLGGQSIYQQFLPYCDTAYVTAIDYAYHGDAYFPRLSEESGWVLCGESEEQTYFDLCYTAQKYTKKL